MITLHPTAGLATLAILLIFLMPDLWWSVPRKRLVAALAGVGGFIALYNIPIWLPGCWMWVGQVWCWW